VGLLAVFSMSEIVSNMMGQDLTIANAQSMTECMVRTHQ
jgi:hypothetical protein